MRTTLRKQEAAYAPTPENWQAARACIAVWTNTLVEGGGLRVDAKRLNDDETAALIELTLRKRDGVALGDRDRETWEKLCEAAAGRQPGSVWEASREASRLVAELAEISREARKPPRRLELAEQGSVTLTRQWCFEYLRSGVLWPSHIALLAYLLAAWENGALPFESPGASLEAGGEIVFDGHNGGLLPDPNGSFHDEKHLLDHLAKLKLVEVRRVGRITRIRPGARLRAVTKRAA